ncbi:polysaccharide pyruvyl transferase family protein [Lachnospiraceae bacterium 42-17]|jgi:hypothetical protein
MKFARLVYNDKMNAITKYSNVGDWFQTFAVDCFYKSMEIEETNIIEINREDLTTYHGEKLIVIMQGWFNQLNKKDVFPISQDIIPIYFGLHRTQKKKISFGENEIVGCRDEATYELMNGLGYESYISGCLTLTFPKREETETQTELFLVDVPEKIYKYIPHELCDGKWNVLSQEIEKTCTPELDAHKYLELYKNKAALVITSRLHCAAPCLGMGIPVILVREYFDDRYGWIDKYLKLYTPDKFSQINWNIDYIKSKQYDIEPIKEKMYSVLRSHIESTTDSVQNEINELHMLYLNRERSNLHAPLKTRLFWKLCEIAPNFSRFVRWKILRKYTVLEKNKKGGFREN